MNDRFWATKLVCSVLQVVTFFPLVLTETNITWAIYGIGGAAATVKFFLPEKNQFLHIFNGVAAIAGFCIIMLSLYHII